MFDLRHLIGEFDSEKKILHLTAEKPIHCTTRAEGYALAKAAKELLKEHLGDQRGYMITDYSKIIIEPKHIEEYASEIKDIIDTYLYPEGLARYGFDISRVTAQISHSLYLGGSPNLFNTKEEAFDYINRQVIKNSPAPETVRR